MSSCYLQTKHSDSSEPQIEHRTTSTSIPKPSEPRALSHLKREQVHRTTAPIASPPILRNEACRVHSLILVQSCSSLPLPVQCMLAPLRLRCQSIQESFPIRNLSMRILDLHELEAKCPAGESRRPESEARSALQSTRKSNRPDKSQAPTRFNNSTSAPNETEQSRAVTLTQKT